LIPHFADEKSVKSDKLLQKRVKNFTWEIRKSTNKKLKEAIKKHDFAEKLELLWQYALQGQLQYYAKTMLLLQKRLNYLKKDLYFKGQNLRHIIPVPVNELEKKALEVLKNRDFKQKTLKELENSKILDDYYRFCKTGDFKSSYILRLIKNNTNELKNLRKNETFVKNYEKVHKELLKEKIENLKEKYYTQEVKQTQENIAQVLKNDLLNIAKSCKNEKELRQKMQEIGYKDFGLKKRSGKVIGYKFKLEDKEIIVKCRDSIDISKVRAILKENNIKAQAGEDLQHTDDLKIKNYSLPLLPKPPKITEKSVILKNEEEIKKIKEIKKEYKNEYDRVVRGVQKEIARANKLERKANRTIGRMQSKVIDTGEFKERIRREINEKNEREIERIKRKFREAIRNNIARRVKQAVSGIANEITEFRERITKLGERIVKIANKIKFAKEFDIFERDTQYEDEYMPSTKRRFRR
jgi:hypothetical protein